MRKSRTNPEYTFETIIALILFCLFLEILLTDILSVGVTITIDMRVVEYLATILILFLSLIVASVIMLDLNSENELLLKSIMFVIVIVLANLLFSEILHLFAYSLGTTVYCLYFGEAAC